MKQPLLFTAVVSATVCGVAVALPVAAQDVPSQVQERAAPVARPDHGPMPPHMGMMPGRDVLGLAVQLSAAEIYLGITPEQLGVWRTYTTALVDLISVGRGRDLLPPPQTAGGQGGVNVPEPQVALGDGVGAEIRLPAEALAKSIMDKAEKAKVLQEATAALKPTLTPEQVRKFPELERMFAAPPPGPMRGIFPENIVPYDHEGPRG